MQKNDRKGDEKYMLCTMERETIFCGGGQKMGWEPMYTVDPNSDKAGLSEGDGYCCQ
jgi:hypothetical protein